MALGNDVNIKGVETIMELLVSNLIHNHILIPFRHSRVYTNRLEIHHILIYEPKHDTFFSTLKEKSLVFFPKGTFQNLTQDQILQLKNLSCFIVFYQSDSFVSKIDSMPFPISVPILLIENDTTISYVVNQCYDLAYNEMQKLAVTSLETIELLSKELLQHKGANENIIKVAMDLLECPVAYATSDFYLQKVPDIPKEYLVLNPLCIEDSFHWDLALETFQLNHASYYPNLAIGINGTPIGGYLYKNKYCLEQGCQIFIFPLINTGNCYGYLLLSLDSNDKTLSPVRSVKIQQILSFLKFEVMKSDEIAHTVNRYYDFLLDELIESEQTDFRKLMEKYGLVQKVIFDEYYVLIVGRSPHSTSDIFFHELLTSQQFNSLYSKLVNILGTINFFLFERKDYIVALLPEPLIKNMQNDFLPLISIFRQFLDEQYQGTGISDVVSTQRVHQGYLQALKALAISQHSFDKTPCLYANLGILRFFFDHSNTLDFAPLLLIYQEYIVPIIEYDKEHSGDLLATLTSYISNCSSPTAICSELYIHKNTLYSRLNKISQILNKELSNSETIFNISLGLKMQTLIQAGILYDDLNP